MKINVAFFRYKRYERSGIDKSAICRLIFYFIRLDLRRYLLIESNIANYIPLMKLIYSNRYLLITNAMI